MVSGWAATPLHHVGMGHVRANDLGNFRSWRGRSPTLSGLARRAVGRSMDTRWYLLCVQFRVEYLGCARPFELAWKDLKGGSAYVWSAQLHGAVARLGWQAPIFCWPNKARRTPPLRYKAP